MFNPVQGPSSVNEIAIRAAQLKQLLQEERRNRASRLSIIPNDLILYYITPYVFNGPFLPVQGPISVNEIAIRAEQLKQLLQRERRNSDSRLSIIPNDLILYYITPYVFNGPFLPDNLVPMRYTQLIKDLTQERKVVKEQISFRSCEMSSDSNTSFRANELGLGLLGMSLIIGGGAALLQPIPTEVSVSLLSVGLVVMSNVSHNYKARLADQQTQLDTLKAKKSTLSATILTLNSEDVATNKDNFVKILKKVKEEIQRDVKDFSLLCLDIENKEDKLILQNKCFQISNKILTNLKKLLQFKVSTCNNSNSWAILAMQVIYLKKACVDDKDHFDLDLLEFNIKTIDYIERIIDSLIIYPPLLNLN